MSKSQENSKGIVDERAHVQFIDDVPSSDDETDEASKESLSDFADDKLDGLDAIARFTGDTKRIAAYRVNNGTYPAYRSGKKILSSKRAIKARRDELLAAAKK